MNKDIIIFILASIIVAGVAYWFGSTKSQTSLQPSPSPTSIISPTPTTKTQTPSSQVETSGLQAIDPSKSIRQALATKHGKVLSETQIEIDPLTEYYAKGVFKFTGEIGGGWFLSAKVGEDWIIAADGNGTVSCTDIDPYNFPTDMVPECWDEATSTLITR